MIRILYSLVPTTLTKQRHKRYLPILILYRHWGDPTFEDLFYISSLHSEARESSPCCIKQWAGAFSYLGLNDAMTTCFFHSSVFLRSALELYTGTYSYCKGVMMENLARNDVIWKYVYLQYWKSTEKKYRTVLMLINRRYQKL